MSENTPVDDISSEEETSPASENIPVLPSPELVPFPSVMMSLYLDRDADIKSVKAAQDGEGMIIIIAQKSSSGEPEPIDLYHMGVLANVVRTLQISDGRYKVLLQGMMRAEVTEFIQEDGFIAASLETVPLIEVEELTSETEERITRIRENLQALVECEHLPEEMLLVTEEIRDPGVLADLITAHFKLEIALAQKVLEESDPLVRLEHADKIIIDDLNQFMVSEKIRDRAEDELTKGQKEYYLREQLKQIQKELGEAPDVVSEDMTSLKQAIKKVVLPEHAAKEVDRQMSRLERMHPETSEYAMLRTYLEWITDLPWSEKTRDRLNLKIAKKLLDEDHYGLEKAKQRILEYLSVKKLKKDSQGPILCLVGPPGVGKTSLGRSIARCLNRQFFRMSLGGVRDEAEIRGHRRTYVGALPGRIIQGLKEAGSNNPVFLFDELDKIGSDFRGDPAAALLEILDPEQNKAFRDHYLNLDFDLSKCLFIATANTVDTIPDALLDRLEVLYISGYTLDEKRNIAQRFLIPQQVDQNGLSKQNVKIKEDAMRFLIERYTREAGVRNLQREIGSLCRKLAVELVDKGKIKKTVDTEVVQKYLGVTRFEPEILKDEHLVGVVKGLAWTTCGGEVMPVEASIAKGKGALILTGQLGDVMQESAQAGMFYARANSANLGLPAGFPDKLDVHIHVPGGATPKDGPSAGVTIVAAMVSALTGQEIRHDIAMTGEITLRGNVLPVGGIKEKALAALRYGITTVIIPQANLKDIEEIPEEQLKEITFIPVKQIDEALKIVIRKKKKTAAKSKTKTSAKAKNKTKSKAKSKRKTGKNKVVKKNLIIGK